MRIFKHYKKICSIILLLFMMISLEILFSKLLVPVTYADYFNKDIEKLCAHDKNSELIFIGASRTYRTFVPEIFESELELDNVINAGSSSQPYSASYYQLKDLLVDFTPKYVVLGVTGDKLVSSDLDQGKMIVWDRIRHKHIRTAFWCNCLENSEKLYSLNSYRYRDNLSFTNIKEIRDEHIKIKNDSYKGDKSQTEYYADTGFIYSNSTYDNGTIPICGEADYSKDNIIDSNKTWLDKIVDLCKQNNIELFLVTGPTSMMRIYNIDNYQEANDFYNNYAKENNIVYHNLNLLKNRESILPDTFMHDYNHVNGEGAEIVSRIYAEILINYLNDNDTSEYFYQSVNELKKSTDRVVGVKADINCNENDIKIEVDSLQHKNIVPKYQILMSIDGGEYEMVEEYTIKKSFVIDMPKCDSLKIKVNATNEKSTSFQAYQIYNIK